ncbi:MAG: Na+/H+ antiporter subunit E [Candidatus Diapherotrites archaeon]|nr:Na+/H+ antiporter subunit E [Candidatus Diapherotrites archaeon]
MIFALVFAACLVFYALLVFDGTALSAFSIASGVAASLIAAAVAARLAPAKWDNKLANPVRWLLFAFYVVVPFFLEMTKANLDVAYRVVTGRISPCIVKISPGLKTTLGTVMLANSITLTPGTLTMHVDGKNDLYVHCLNARGRKPSCADVCASLPEWVRRVTE